MLHAHFVLEDVSTGRAVVSSPVIFRTTVSGFSTVRFPVRSFEIPHAGEYRLRVDGIDPAKDVSRVQLIVTRPYTASVIGCILILLAGGILLIGSSVIAALGFAGKLG
jgi:hypothetical protein